MRLDLFLARHGESVWHDGNRYAGVSDVDLTPTGRLQAAGLAGWASGARLDTVACSPLARSRDTAAPAAVVAGVEPVVDPRFAELDFGVAEGLTAAELAARRPEAWEAFRTDPVVGHFPGGEHPAAAADRLLAGVADLAGGRVLLVSHSTVLRLALCCWLGLPLSGYRRLLPRLDNCALAHVRLDSGGCALLSLNVPMDVPPKGAP